MASNYMNNFGLATITASSVSITAEGYAGSRIILNRAAGITVTLPAATGTGNRYEFIMLVDASGNHIIKVANSTDVMMGWAALGNDSAGSSNFYTADSSDTITLGGTVNGGKKGARVTLDDVASGFWAVMVESEASGTEETPFSATV